MAGVLQSPHQIDFLNKVNNFAEWKYLGFLVMFFVLTVFQVYREYGGSQLTRGLEKIKTIPEEVKLKSLANRAMLSQMSLNVYQCPFLLRS